MNKSIKKSFLFLGLLFICATAYGDHHKSNWSFKKETDKTSLYFEGQLVTSFHPAAENKPALHPLIASDGQDLTRAYPFSSREGEKTDHPHHTGVWFTHGDVNGLDFWHNGRGKPGEIVEQSFTTKTQNNQAIATGTYAWKNSQTQDVLLKSKRIITFTRHKDDILLDFEIVLTAQDEDVIFGDTKEGSFALRLHPMMDAKKKDDKGTMLNSNGGSGKGIWGKKAKWVAYGGENKSGKNYSISVFDHPQNLRHPTTWHARDYGLLAANPFGLSYYIDKNTNGDHTIEAQKSLTFKYRILVQAQKTDAKNIEEHYKHYIQN